MTKAEKKFGLTIEEIRELKCWYVKTQDFETAVMWREMERMIVPPLKDVDHPIQLNTGNGIEILVTLVLSDGWTLNKPQ